MQQKPVDFDPDEPIIFPQPVVQAMDSPAFMAAIQATAVPPDQAALWFLGQNSWILKDPGGTIIAIDPYLTDWCASKDSGVPAAKSRLLPIFIQPEDLQADIILISHSHADHCDPFTLSRLSPAVKQSARVLAPWQCLPILSAAGIPTANVTLMHPLQTIELPGKGGASQPIQVTGVFALPTDATDLNHIGYVVKFANGKTYYNSGDTAFHELLGHVRAFQPEVMSICINGGYHNLSHWEAARITAAIKPRVAIPAHYDMMPHNLQSPHMFRKSLWEQDKEIVYQRMEYYRPYFF